MTADLSVSVSFRFRVIGSTEENKNKHQNKNKNRNRNRKSKKDRRRGRGRGRVDGYIMDKKEAEAVEQEEKEWTDSACHAYLPMGLSRNFRVSGAASWDPTASSHRRPPPPRTFLSGTASTSPVTSHQSPVTSQPTVATDQSGSSRVNAKPVAHLTRTQTPSTSSLFPTATNTTTNTITKTITNTATIANNITNTTANTTNYCY